MNNKWKNGFLGVVSLGLSMQVIALQQPLKIMNDEELAEIHGQSLMSLTYLAPTDSENTIGLWSTK